MVSQLSGAQVAARCLDAAGVRRVFSLSGNQVLPLYDALFELGIEIVHTRHEGAAVHMADAWSRLTETPCICLVTAGPGHANALGALSMAEAAESPLVLLSGSAPLGRAGAFQEMDQVALVRPLSRWAEVARRPDALPELLAQAFRAAQRGRPGPVHLSLPADMLTSLVDETAVRWPRPTAFLPEPQPASAAAIGHILETLRAAERPLILAGPQAARAQIYGRLHTLSRLNRVPFVIVDHPRGLGDPSLGQLATAIPRADVILLLGKRQDYRIAYAGPPVISDECRLLQIDPWPQEIGRHRQVEIGVVAGLIDALDQLLDATRDRRPTTRNTWITEIEALRRTSLIPATAATPDIELPQPATRLAFSETPVASGASSLRETPATAMGIGPIVGNTPDIPGTGGLHPALVFDTLRDVLGTRLTGVQRPPGEPDASPDALLSIPSMIADAIERPDQAGALEQSSQPGPPDQSSPPDHSSQEATAEHSSQPDHSSQPAQSNQPEVTLIIDGGEFGQWARERLRARPPHHLVAEPLGSIGFSVPFAIAARLARPQTLAIAIAGDGAFGFHAMELETAARAGAPILVIVGTDGAWGTERHIQVARYGRHRTVATDLLPVRYDRLAEALGSHGEYVERPEQLHHAFQRALEAIAAGQPALVNIRIACIPSPAGGP